MPSSHNKPSAQQTLKTIQVLRTFWDKKAVNRKKNKARALSYAIFSG